MSTAEACLQPTLLPCRLPTSEIHTDVVLCLPHALSAAAPSGPFGLLVGFTWIVHAPANVSLIICSSRPSAMGAYNNQPKSGQGCSSKVTSHSSRGIPQHDDTGLTVMDSHRHACFHVQVCAQQTNGGAFDGADGGRSWNASHGGGQPAHPPSGPQAQQRVYRCWQPGPRGRHGPRSTLDH